MVYPLSSKRLAEAEPEFDPSTAAPLCVKARQSHIRQPHDYRKTNIWNKQTSLTRQSSSESLGTTVSSLSMSSALGCRRNMTASPARDPSADCTNTANTLQVSPTPSDFSHLQVKHKPRKYPSVETVVGLIQEDDEEALLYVEDREEDSNPDERVVRNHDRHSRFEQQLAAKLAAAAPIEGAPGVTTCWSNVAVAAPLPPPRFNVPVSLIDYSANAILHEEPSFLTTDCEIGSSQPQQAAVEQISDLKFAPCLSVRVLENDDEAETMLTLLLYTYWKCLVALVVLTCLVSIAVALSSSKNSGIRW